MVITFQQQGFGGIVMTLDEEGNSGIITLSDIHRKNDFKSVQMDRGRVLPEKKRSV